MDNDLMTLNEAAEQVGVQAQTLWSAIKRNRLKAQKKGRDWFVTQKALDDWRVSRGPGGRPRKIGT